MTMIIIRCYMGGNQLFESRRTEGTVSVAFLSWAMFTYCRFHLELMMRSHAKVNQSSQTKARRHQRLTAIIQMKQAIEEENDGISEPLEGVLARDSLLEHERIGGAQCPSKIDR
ncbi:hypothetical protein ACLOJK_001131 [Asimina triloba]